jgi:hypothetical protein
MRSRPDILRRYWFEFEAREGSPGKVDVTSWPRTNVGVTAYDYDDAIALLKRQVFASSELPQISRVLVDFDMAELLMRDKHVGPSRCCPVWRGVWYPNYCGNGPFIGSVKHE